MKALIVGGSGGIGSVIATEYARSGYEVVITYHSNKALAEKTQKSIQRAGNKAVTKQVDVSDPISTEKLFESIGDLDVMIFSVANEKVLAVDEASYEDWRDITAPMIDGAFLCTHYAVPLLKKSKNPNIVFIPSLDGIRPNGEYIAYQTSEAALIALTKANANYLAKKYIIRVNAVLPGQVRTPLWDKVVENNNDELWEKFAEQNPLGRVAEPIDIARACLFLTEDDGKFINGNFIHVNGKGEF